MDDIFDVAHKGVRRAYIFMGFGWHAAHNPDLKEFQLEGGTQLMPASEELPDHVIGHLKSNFAEWVVANGLRELIETFAIFLDQYYQACLMIDKSRMVGARLRWKPDREFTRAIQAFEKLGIAQKFETLSKDTGIEFDFSPQIISLHKTRNCLTHNRGVVRPRDCENSTLSTHWRALETFIKEPSGNETIVTHQTEYPIQFSDGGDICIRIVNRTKEFPVNTVVRFDGYELAEICWSINNVTEIAKDPLINFAELNNVPINLKNQENGLSP